MRTNMTTNDVEKRCYDPAAFRAASVYVVSIIAMAGLAFALFLLIGREVPLWALGAGNPDRPSGRRDRSVGQDLAGLGSRRDVAHLAWRWMVLLTLMLVSPSIPGMAMSPGVAKSEWAVQFSALSNLGVDEGDGAQPARSSPRGIIENIAGAV